MLDLNEENVNEASKGIEKSVPLHGDVTNQESIKKAFEKYQFNEENGDLQNAKDVMLNNSVISLIFITFVVAKLFFTNTPMLLGNILVLLILILSIPLVQPYIYKRFKKIIYCCSFG